MGKGDRIRFITFTAMGIALVVAAQYLGSLLPAGAVIVGPFAVKQLITGSLVNCILLVFTACVGVGSAVLIGIISAVLASVIGVGPQVVPIVPLIACGNALLAFVYHLLSVKAKLPGIVGVIAAAVIKCAFLWLTVPAALRLFASVPEKQAAALSVMFSWPQGLTALVGGVLALLIIPRLVKVKNSEE